VLGLLLVLVCVAPSSRSDFQTLRVLYTSDLHSRTAPSLDFGSTGLPRRVLGGWDNLVRLISDQRTDATLLLDCGDFGFGSPVGDSSHGRAAVEFMNQAGYDAAVAGPRDFTGGAENFQVLAKMASFPILADPMLDVVLKRQVPLFRPFLVRDVKGARLAVVGITDPDISRLNRRDDVGAWTIDSPSAQLARYLPAVLAESVDVVIVIGHLSVGAACAIADSFRDVDMVICRGSAIGDGGRMAHSRTTPVLTAAAWGQRLGVADVLFHKTERRVYQTEARMLNVEPAPAADTSAAARWLRQSGAASEDTAVCLNPVEYLPDSNGLLGLGALVADGVRREAGADIVILPAYEIEGGLGSGGLGREALFAAVPYRQPVRLLSVDDTTLARLVAPESVGLHEPVPLLAGADYFVTGDTLAWPEVSQVGRARVRNRLPGAYRVVTTEQWLERARIPITGKLLARSLTDLWMDYAAAQETLGPVQPARRYPATPGIVRQPAGGLVNINTAGPELLQTLPGIGPTTAERIIEYRETRGRFSSIDDVQNVKGIGPKKYERIKALITVR
jgi:competence ComEA-like helix-hairpin-helix protein